MKWNLEGKSTLVGASSLSDRALMVVILGRRVREMLEHHFVPPLFVAREMSFLLLQIVHDSSVLMGYRKVLKPGEWLRGAFGLEETELESEEGVSGEQGGIRTIRSIPLHDSR